MSSGGSSPNFITAQLKSKQFTVKSEHFLIYLNSECKKKKTKTNKRRIRFNLFKNLVNLVASQFGRPKKPYL